MSMKLFYGGILVALLIVIGIGIYYYRKGKSQKFQDDKKYRELLPKPLKVKRFEQYAGRTYPLLTKIPAIRILLNRIRMRLSTLHAGDEFLIRKKSASYTIIVILIEGALLIADFILSRNWGMRLAILLVSLYIAGFIIDMFINRLKLQILEGETELLLNIRHQYNETVMVKESIEEGAKKSKPLVATHARKIVEILESEEPINDMEEYLQSAPNPYMRRLAGVSLKIREFSDGGAENGKDSIYLDALSHLREEIFYEVNYRKRLQTKLGGLPFIAASPIFFLDPIRIWAEQLPGLSDYYSGQWGIYSVSALFVIFIFAFFGVRLNKRVEGDPQGVNDEGKRLNQLLKVRWIRHLVNRQVPAEEEARNFKIKEKIREANSKLSIQAFYLQKIGIAVLAFLIVIVLQFSVHVSLKNYFMNPKIENATVQTTGNQEISEERATFEKMLLGQIVSKHIPPNQAPAYVLSQLSDKYFFSSDFTKDDFIADIMNRTELIKNQHIWWYEVIAAFAVSYMSFFVPNFMLQLRKNSRKWERQSEVDSINTTVMMLSKIPSISVFEIVEWIERDSYIFKDALAKCVLNFSDGGKEALEELKYDVRFEPFDHIVDRLINAQENIPIEKAFSDMVTERAFQSQDRHDNYDKMLTSKSVSGKFFGYLPIQATFVVYMLFPILYMLYEKMDVVSAITNGLN